MLQTQKKGSGDARQSELPYVMCTIRDRIMKARNVAWNDCSSSRDAATAEAAAAANPYIHRDTWIHRRCEHIRGFSTSRLLWSAFSTLERAYSFTTHKRSCAKEQQVQGKRFSQENLRNGSAQKRTVFSEFSCSSLRASYRTHYREGSSDYWSRRRTWKIYSLKFWFYI